MDGKKSADRSCEYCEKSFSTASAARRHTENVHGVKPAYGSMKCAFGDYCKATFHRGKEYRNHLQSIHKVHLETALMTFISLDEFQNWKEEEEKTTKSRFIAYGRSSQEYRRYICNRSGCFTPKGKGERALKCQGSVKIGFACPATMEVLCIKENVSVTYHKTHVGHDCSLANVSLTPKEREEIAGKLSQGVSFSRVLDDIRESVIGNIERKHLISRKDLHNISQSFNIAHSEQYHENDSTSVHLWVQAQQALPNCCVRHYKPQGVAGDDFDKKDFFLVIMTDGQKEILKKFGSGIVCVDTTHGTTGYDFNLTTLLVVDDFGCGCPVAFFISTLVDTKAIKLFFEAVKKEVGCVSPSVFMSDDAPAYINAWKSVYGSPKKQLLCTWHVDRAWRKQLLQLRCSQEKKVLLYKTVHCLLQTPDENVFRNLFSRFLEEGKSDDDIASFMAYFEQHYSCRTELWAHCFRADAGINTNMFLEAFHRVLKYVYLEGKRNKRVDKLVHCLLKISRDKVFEQIIGNTKGKVTMKISQINKRHRESQLISHTDITAGDDAFFVLSQTDRHEEYMVRSKGDCKQRCNIRCQLCNICCHNYVCTCRDYIENATICKHIHAVVGYISATAGGASCSKSSTAQHKSDSFCATLSNLVSQRENPYEKMKANLRGCLETLLSGVTCDKYPSECLEYMTEKVKQLISYGETMAFDSNSAPAVSTCPPNTKVTCQKKFYSVKRKSTSVSQLKKPTQVEVNGIKKMLLDGDGELLVIGAGSDHNYAVNSEN